MMNRLIYINNVKDKVSKTYEKNTKFIFYKQEFKNDLNKCKGMSGSCVGRANIINLLVSSFVRYTFNIVTNCGFTSILDL